MEEETIIEPEVKRTKPEYTEYELFVKKQQEIYEKYLHEQQLEKEKHRQQYEKLLEKRDKEEEERVFMPFSQYADYTIMRNNMDDEKLITLKITKETPPINEIPSSLAPTQDLKITTKEIEVETKGIYLYIHKNTSALPMKISWFKILI